MCSNKSKYMSVNDARDIIYKMLLNHFPNVLAEIIVDYHIFFHSAEPQLLSEFGSNPYYISLNDLKQDEKCIGVAHYNNFLIAYTNHGNIFVQDSTVQPL